MLSLWISQFHILKLTQNCKFFWAFKNIIVQHFATYLLQTAVHLSFMFWVFFFFYIHTGVLPEARKILKPEPRLPQKINQLPNKI